MRGFVVRHDDEGIAIVTDIIQQIVFIDARVPDVADLLNGLQPGAQAFVLDPASDGVQQIADILAANNLTDLASISIVGHGAAGAIDIGSTVLDDGDLSQHSAALAQIGASLKTGGDLQLYGCDVASGASGQQFIADLSHYTGGADVAAATHLVGGAAFGGSWTLDASTGPVQTSVPFTSASQANFQGLLANPTLTAVQTSTLTTDADGDGGISPGDTVKVSVVITNTSATDATGVSFSETLSGLTATGTVTVTPIAANDSYSVTGNIPITINAANGVLANDIVFNGAPPTATNLIQSDAVTHGNVALNSDGSFTYTPDTGFSGTASFQYTAHDAAGNSDQTATVTLNVASPIWFVNNANVGTQDGTSAHPFTSIAAAISAAAADTDHGVGDTIIVTGGGATYTASTGITLASGEKLVGQSNPTFSVSSGTAVTLGTNNTVTGISITESGAGAGISGASFGTLHLANVVVNTGSGAGISLTTAGTVDATGTNTISTGSGTALNVTNVNIGSANLTFKSISDNGGANGIVLNNTGSGGHLVVTGDGSNVTDGSNSTGGTIQNTTGDGISLTNTTAPSFTNMLIQNTVGSGISGTGVHGFTFNNGKINNSGTGHGVQTSNIAFNTQSAGTEDNIDGAITISGNLLTNAYYHGVSIFNFAGTITDANISNNTITSGTTTGSGGTSQGSGIQFVGFGSATTVANVTKAEITGNHITNFPGGDPLALEFGNTNSSGPTGTYGTPTNANAISVTGNTITGGGTPLPNNTILAVLDGKGTGHFDISNNVLGGSAGNTIDISSQGSANLAVNIANNTIDDTGQNVSGTGGIAAGAGQFQMSNGSFLTTPTLTVAVTGNTIQHNFGAGIRINDADGSPTVNATIKNNTVSTAPQSFEEGIQIIQGGAVTGSTVNLDISNNTSKGGTGSGFTAPGIGLREQNPGNTFNIVGLTPNPANGPQTEAYVSSKNPNSTSGSFGTGGTDIINSGTSTFHAIASTTLPFLAPPATLTTPTIGGAPQEGQILTATAAVGDSGATITYQWQENFGSGYINIAGATGLTYQATEADIGATLRIVASEVDTDAAVATATSAATGAVTDHLTLTAPTISGTVQQGQVLTASAALADNPDATVTYQWEANHGSGFVAISGATGLSYRPVAADVGATLEVVASATDPHGGSASATGIANTTVAAFTALTLPTVTIGTLPAGKAVTITSGATVNGQTDQLIVNPSNSGTVSGTNFTSLNTNTNVTTLDTLTLGNLVFNDKNIDGTFDGTDTGISGVHLTLFADNGTTPGAFDVGDTKIATTTTAADGTYSFSGLAAGNYIVRIDASNFTTGGVLTSFANTSLQRDTTPNDGIDNDNNGLALSNGFVVTTPISLSYRTPATGGDTNNSLDVGLIMHIPPSLSSVAASVSFTEGAAVTLSGSASVSDPDSLDLASATVKVAGGTFAGDGDVLATSTIGTAITASYNASSETLTLTGSDTLANYQIVLDKITFASSQNPDDYGSQKTRTVTWVLNDGSGSNNLSTAQTTTVSITAINDPPVLTSVAPSAAYLENAAGVTLASTAAVSDVDSLTLSGATVAIVGGTFAGDGDVLAANGLSSGTISLGAGSTITISYSSSTETLTLTGSDTLAHYQTLLEEVSFRSTSDNPTSFGADPTRTVTWLLNDGAGSNNLSSVTTTTISVTAVNDAPTLSVATSASFTENVASIALSSAVTVSDPDNTTWTGATVKIATGTFAGDGDVLAADTTGTAITASYDASTETLTLSGTDTLADYRQVLQSVSFVTASDNPTNFGAAPTRTITWVVNDGSGSNNLSTTQTETLSITAVNDPPTLSAVASSASYTEQAAATVLSSALSVSDPDNLKLATATVKITGGTFAGDGDVLSFSTAGTSISASYNASTETLTLSGSDTLANYRAVLDSVAFSSTSDNPTLFGSDTTRTITWVVDDGSGSSSLSAPATTTVTLTAVNDAPTLTGTTNASFTENSPTPTTLSPSVTVSDPDNQTLVGATVAITGGTFVGDGDVLATSTAGTSITASYDAGTETLILSGSDTLANYRTVLDKVTFTTPSDNPTLFGSDPTRTVTWVLNDGSGSNNLSAAQTSTITVTATNDPPTLSAVPSSVTFVEKAGPVTLSGGASASDPDSLKLASATVKITGGTFASDGDVLGFSTAGTSITASYDAGTETLTLTGSDTLADYRTVLDSITFDAPGNLNPTNFGSNPTRTVTWTLNDGSPTSATATTTVTITPVDDAPTLNPPAQAAFTENQASPVTLSGAASASDPDNLALASATVKITGGTFAGDGDVLGFSTTGTSITAAYNSVNETLTLTGSDTLADYRAVLDSITFDSTSLNPTDFGSDSTRTVSWTVNDGTSAGTATSTVTLTAVNDPPTLTGVASVTTVATSVPSTLSPQVTVADPDNLTLTGATVSISGADIVDGTFSPSGNATGDVLGFSTGGTSITAIYDSTTETLTLSGSDTLAHYQQVLDSVTFTATGADPTNGGSDTTRSLTWTLNDGTATSTAATTTTVTIPAVNGIAPTLSDVASSVTAVPTVVTTSSPTRDGHRSGQPSTIVGATVSIATGTFGGDGDVLAIGGATSGTITGITFAYDSASEVLTLAGTATNTLADFQSVLDTVTFNTPRPTRSMAGPIRPAP